MYAYQDGFSHDDVHFAYESTFQRENIVNSRRVVYTFSVSVYLRYELFNIPFSDCLL